VRCPYCAQEAPRRALHRHLTDAHADRVTTSLVEAEGRMLYRLACPQCGGEIRHQVKPRWRDPGFLEEFGTEIRLVAFDLLLHHLADAHEPPRED